MYWSRKLGTHLILLSEDAKRQAGALDHVKALDQPEFLRSLKEARPQVTTFHRHYFDDAGQDVGRSPEAVADELLSSMHGQEAFIDYACVFCEWATYGEELRAQLRQLRRVGEILRGRGVKLAGPEFKNGSPEFDDWRIVVDEGFGGVDLLSVHEYWGNSGHHDWLSLRHRRVHQWLHELGGPDLVHPDFAVTECGRDKCDGGLGGWVRDEVVGLVTKAGYFAELCEYGRLLDEDPYVRFATPFTAGPTWGPNGTLGWQAFTLDPFTDDILAALAPPT